ncbi:hypothetical protein ADUPG1_008005 [Aduncisulcus paluster]|uniref:RRM domain-containing protein n=1 Tax=Aduncisulcus paluster TaxID=2918883 RepID=A0ABQ5KQD3_9EUKA|nr:hypothetical protein ADUPG1_008005 [Aduncisulcus paluster]
MTVFVHNLPPGVSNSRLFTIACQLGRVVKFTHRARCKYCFVDYATEDEEIFAISRFNSISLTDSKGCEYRLGSEPAKKSLIPEHQWFHTGMRPSIPISVSSSLPVIPHFAYERSLSHPNYHVFSDCDVPPLQQCAPMSLSSSWFSSIPHAMPTSSSSDPSTVQSFPKSHHMHGSSDIHSDSHILPPLASSHVPYLSVPGPISTFKSMGGDHPHQRYLDEYSSSFDPRISSSAPYQSFRSRSESIPSTSSSSCSTSSTTTSSSSLDGSRTISHSSSLFSSHLLDDPSTQPHPGPLTYDSRSGHSQAYTTSTNPPQSHLESLGYEPFSLGFGPDYPPYSSGVLSQTTSSSGTARDCEGCLSEEEGMTSIPKILSNR